MVVSQVAPARRAIPEINDLVRITLGAVDDPDAERFASEVPSRIEDAAYDRQIGKPLGYLIAAPWFSGDLEDAGTGTECALQWVSPQGLWTLPCSFEAQEATSHGLRVWRVAVTGDGPSRGASSVRPRGVVGADLARGAARPGGAAAPGPGAGRGGWRTGPARRAAGDGSPGRS